MNYGKNSIDSGSNSDVPGDDTEPRKKQALQRVRQGQVVRLPPKRRVYVSYIYRPDCAQEELHIILYLYYIQTYFSSAVCCINSTRSTWGDGAPYYRILYRPDVQIIPIIMIFPTAHMYRALDSIRSTWRGVSNYMYTIQTCCCLTLLYMCVKRPHLKWLYNHTQKTVWLIVNLIDLTARSDVGQIRRSLTGVEQPSLPPLSAGVTLYLLLYNTILRVLCPITSQKRSPGTQYLNKPLSMMTRVNRIP